eukprot:5912336-Heterocapsa_arctica.AAC.1
MCIRDSFSRIPEGRDELRELVETRGDLPLTLGEAFASILRRRGVDEATAAAMTAPTSSSTT